MEEFFIIGRQKLDKSWNLKDLYEPNNAFDYCEQLKINANNAIKSLYFIVK